MTRIRHSAFTLIELIAVMAVIAIVAALAFPATSRVVASSRAAGCISNLHSLGVSLNLYLGEHNEIMPTLQPARTSTSVDVPVIDNTLNAYGHEPHIFLCPADKQGIGAATGTSYYWNSLLDGQSVTHLQFFLLNVVSRDQNSEIPVLSDKEAFHPYEANKVNFLYADGHASQDLILVTSQ